MIPGNLHNLSQVAITLQVSSQSTPLPDRTISSPLALPLFLLQMSDENAYEMPPMDEEHWFKGAHLGNQVQACNWQVVNCTTPANYFHVLRRQVRLLSGTPSRHTNTTRLVSHCCD